MSEFRNELLGRMIRIYGFESPLTIDFAWMCERYPAGEAYDKTLRIVVECNEAHPYISDDE